MPEDLEIEQLGGEEIHAAARQLEAGGRVVYDGMRFVFVSRDIDYVVCEVVSDRPTAGMTAELAGAELERGRAAMERLRAGSPAIARMSELHSVRLLDESGPQAYLIAILTEHGIKWV